MSNAAESPAPRIVASRSRRSRTTSRLRSPSTTGPPPSSPARGTCRPGREAEITFDLSGNGGGGGAARGHQPLSIAFLGLSITSSRGNDRATNHRGRVRSLSERGHRVLFLERDTPRYSRHRDLRRLLVGDCDAMTDPTMPPAAAADRFESHRPRLVGLAYRMLGSRAEAEDVVQDAYLRWHRATGTVEDDRAWLTTVTSRLAIDRLRALRRERETYRGHWLPEPLVAREPPPDRRLDAASDLSIAFLTLIERLGPEERAALLLRDVFDCGYRDIAAALGKSEAACRQTVHRARQRLHDDRPRFPSDEAARRRLVESFRAALAARDEETLFALLAPDVALTGDGGGKVASSPHVLRGAPLVVKLLLGLGRKSWRDIEVELAEVNGETGLLVRRDGEVIGVMAFTTDDERIHALHSVLNPDKLPADV